MRWILVILFASIAPPAQGAVIVVDTLADRIAGPVFCDIRDAISAANLDHAVGGCEGGNGDDVIDLTGLAGTFELDSELPSIKSNVVFQAAGPSQLAMSGQGGSRVFRVIAGSVAIRNMTILSGLADRGAAVWVDPSNSTSLRIEGCRITGNVAGTGAAIANDGGSIVIQNSLIDANSATDPDGAAILNAGGALVIENTTISGNTADGVVSLDAQSGPDTSTSINAATFFHNTNAGRYNLFSETGAVTQLTHTLLSASGTTGSNCSGSVLSTGYNISDDASCSLAALGDQINVNAAVDALAANGGPTATHALQPASPALDGGVIPPCVGLEVSQLVVDQRGLPRGTDGNLDDVFRCDVGAYEAPGPLPVPEPATPVLAAAACVPLIGLASRRSLRDRRGDPLSRRACAAPEGSRAPRVPRRHWARRAAPG